MRIYLTILICLFFAGCAGFSQKRLAKVLEQADSLKILPASDDCRPHFRPSKRSCRNVSNFFEGASQAGSKAVSNLEGLYFEDPFTGMAVFSYIGVSVIAGGCSNTYRQPPRMMNHYRFVLGDAFEERNPRVQVAQIIHTTYNGNRFDSGGERLFVKIHRMEYGLCAGKKDNITSHFFMEVGIELLPSENGRRSYHRDFKYKSAYHTLREWVANENRILQDEYNRACQYLGDLISGEFLEAKYLSLRQP